MDKIVRAQFLATFNHGLQKRKCSGFPYIIHPTRVAMSVITHYNNYKDHLLPLDDLISAAYLHDTLEDTDIDEIDISNGCGNSVLELVKELTSDIKNYQSKGHYLVEKMNKMSNSALFLKLLDRLDNISDANNTKNTHGEFAKKYADETSYINKGACAPFKTPASKLKKKRKL